MHHSSKAADPLKKQKLHMLMQFLNGSKRYFILAILTAALTVLAETVVPQIIRAAVDCATGASSADMSAWVLRLADRVGGIAYLGSHLWIMALFVLAVSAVQVSSQYGFRVFNTKASETLVKTMRDRLFSHIERLPFSWHMKNKTGDIIQRCTSDIDTTRNFLTEQLTAIFRIVILLALSLGFMLSMNPLLAVISLLPTPFILAYSLVFHKKIFEGFTDCDENEGKLSAMAQENLTGVRVVRAFGLERSEIDKFQKQNARYTDLWVKMSQVMSRFWSVSDFLSSMQVMLVVIFGAIFCIQGSMTAGQYVAFISYTFTMMWPIRQLGRMISEMSKASVSIDRIFFIINSPVEQDAANATDAPMNGDIAFEHVSFAYDGAPEMLHDVSFSMKAGTTLGILGGTGSGKTTLMLLLDKLYDLPENGGRITIGGTDIRSIKTEHLRRNIGMVLQEPFLFSRTIAENIAIASPGAGLDAIRDAARAAALDETVSAFPQGYDTMVGERGVTLSGGQKQRVAIARTLMQDTPIMVFDDSLSAVDTETDAKIRHAISRRFGKATVILISHRITTLSSADQIIVLDHGRIAERGTHEELKHAGGIYQKIYETQSSTEEEMQA
ncbi:MAG: ABC transporter ATP-binding protein/permease [Clostridiales bacterium]|nr:ABC transporter ATP-binding protein/permease [Clostridiales bacterium]